MYFLKCNGLLVLLVLLELPCALGESVLIGLLRIPSDLLLASMATTVLRHVCMFEDHCGNGIFLVVDTNRWHYVCHSCDSVSKPTLVHFSHHQFDRLHDVAQALR